MAGAVGYGVRPIVLGTYQYEWISAACWLAAFVALHPLMDKDLPTLFDIAMLKSFRTYIAATLLIAAQLVDSYYYHPGPSAWRIIIEANRK